MYFTTEESTTATSRRWLTQPLLGLEESTTKTTASPELDVETHARRGIVEPIAPRQKDDDNNDNDNDDDEEEEWQETWCESFISYLILPLLLIIQFAMAFALQQQQQHSAALDDGGDDPSAVALPVGRLPWSTVLYGITLFVITSYLYRRSLYDARLHWTLLLLLPEIIMDAVLGLILWGHVLTAFLFMLAALLVLSSFVVVCSLYMLLFHHDHHPSTTTTTTTTTWSASCDGDDDAGDKMVMSSSASVKTVTIDMV